MTTIFPASRRPVLLAAAAIGLTLAIVTQAQAAGSGMPWEEPLQQVLESVQGPVAKIVAVIIIIVTGLRRTGGRTHPRNANCLPGQRPQLHQSPRRGVAREGMKDEIVMPPGGVRTASPADRVSSQKPAPPHLGHRSQIDADRDEARKHRPAISEGAALLTTNDILSRLSMTSTEPAKWMRRTFEKYRVPYVHLCGQVRATEAQYQLLLERVSCFPAAAVEKTASKVEWRKSVSTSASRSSVHERVTQMLRRTDART